MVKGDALGWECVDIYWTLKITQYKTKVATKVGILSEHVKLLDSVQSVNILRAPVLTSTALIHEVHRSCTAYYWDPLLHNDITELLDVGHMALLHFPLEDHHRCSTGFRSGNTLGHSITFSFLSEAVVILVVCLGSLSCRSGQFLKGGHHVLLHNVTVHVGIHVLNEAQLPSTSGTQAAPDRDAITIMLDCRQDTMFLVLLTRASTHMLDTIWAKHVYLSLIRPQDMVPEIHALGLLSTNCLQAFLWANLRRDFLLWRRPCKPTCCSVRRMIWALTGWTSASATSKAMLARSCVCFLKPASAPDTQHEDSTSLIDPCEACYERNPVLKKPLYDPGHCILSLSVRVLPIFF